MRRPSGAFERTGLQRQHSGTGAARETPDKRFNPEQIAPQKRIRGHGQADMESVGTMGPFFPAGAERRDSGVDVMVARDPKTLPRQRRRESGAGNSLRVVLLVLPVVIVSLFIALGVLGVIARIFLQ